MKIVSLALFFIVPVALSSPASDMNRIIDAIYLADGYSIFNALSSENREALSMVISMAQMAPEQVAAQLQQHLSVQVTPSEVLGFTPPDLISIIVASPLFREEIPYSRDMINCEGFTMLGDTAFVHVAIVNEDSVYSYPMVFQEGSWKIAEAFFSADGRRP